jgi:hypothetical protein
MIDAINDSAAGCPGIQVHSSRVFVFVLFPQRLLGGMLLNFTRHRNLRKCRQQATGL